MFRNLRLYRVSTPWPKSESALSGVLAENTFSPCGSFSERSAGWEAPADYENASLCRRVGGADLLQLRTQDRVLPLAAITEAMESRVLEYRSRLGQEPPRAELRRLREETRDELLPNALLKSDRTRGCFLLSESILAIDVASDAKAEWFIDHLRICFGRFACTPLAFRTPPSELLKRIFLGETPLRLSLGRECRMQDLRDSKSIAIWRDIELSDESIRRHVIDGMQLTHLAVVFNDALSCVISEEAVISKLKFLQGQTAESLDIEDPLLRMDADIALLGGTATQLVNDLGKLLGGYLD
jgi:recombination associated protein RdgC